MAAQAIPGRTHEQRLEALKVANEIRFARAEIKRELKATKLSPQEAFTRPEVETMRIDDFLRSIPRIGAVKANRLLSRSRISPTRSIGALSQRQVLELVDQLP